MDAWGVTDGYWDVAGEWHTTDEDVRQALLEAMGAEGDGPRGRRTGRSATARPTTSSPSARCCSRTVRNCRPWPSSRRTCPSATTSSYPRTAARPPGSSSPPAPARRRPRLGLVGPALCAALRLDVGYRGPRRPEGPRPLDRFARRRRRPRQPAAREPANAPPAAQPVLPGQPALPERSLRPGGRRPGCDARRGDLAAADGAGRALTGRARLERNEVMALKLTLLERIFNALGEEAGGEPFRRWLAVQGPAPPALGPVLRPRRDPRPVVVDMAGRAQAPFEPRGR